MTRGLRIRGGQMPFIRLLFPCMAGVLVGTLMEPDVCAAGVLGYVLWTMVLAGLAGIWFPHCFDICLMLFLFVLCWQRTWQAHPSIDPVHFSRHKTLALMGYLGEEPQVRERSVRVMFVVTGGIVNGATGQDGGDTLPLRGHLQLTIGHDSSRSRDLLPDDPDRLDYGTKLIIGSRFSEVSPPRNPGEMDYAAHLAKKDCWHQAYVTVDGMKVTGQGGGNRLLAYAITLRKAMVTKFGRYIRDPEALAVASTLILGYRADLDRDLMQTYSHTGTIHVLSVSGMHVVIVFWLFARLLFWMDWHRTLKMLRFPLLLLSLSAYALLTGLSPSVLRAALMLGFVLWAEAWKRRSNTFNSIGASAFLLILYQPKLLLDIGFQLSYLAVVSIVGLYPLLRAWFIPKWKLLRPVTDYSAMSISAQAGAFPLAMYYFQQFPLYFLPANLLIVLPASAIMYLGFALLLIPEMALTTGLLDMLGLLLSWLIVWMNQGLVWIQRLPGPNLSGIDTSMIQCILLYAMMLCLLFSFLGRSKIRFMVLLGLILVSALSWTYTVWEKWQYRKLVIHQMRSALAISIVGRGQVLLYSDLPEPDHPSLSFAVLPFLKTYIPQSAIRFVNTAGSVYSDGGFYLGDGLIQVGKHRLYVYQEPADPSGPSALWDSSARTGPSAGLKVDVLLVRGNPRELPERILEIFPCRTLVLDGSNHERTIRKFIEKSQELGIEPYILKNNYAYVWVLDKAG